MTEQNALKQVISESSPGNMQGGGVSELIVKWFNPAKGYGFLVPEDESEDIFLHFSILDASGYRFLAAGDQVLCKLGPGKRGQQVTEILDVHPAKQLPGMAFADTYTRYDPQPVGPLEEVTGCVKWFNTIKGFGFVTSEDGGKDIFVHASVLKRLGLSKIYPSQRVRMQVSDSDRGRQAWTLELLDGEGEFYPDDDEEA